MRASGCRCHFLPFFFFPGPPAIALTSFFGSSSCSVGGGGPPMPNACIMPAMPESPLLLASMPCEMAGEVGGRRRWIGARGVPFVGGPSR